MFIQLHKIYVECKNSTVVLPFKNSAFAFTVAVPLTVEDVKVAVTEALPAGILTGLSTVPLFVTNSTVTSSGIGIGIPFLSSILIVIIDLDFPSAGISVGSAESFSFISGVSVKSQ